MAKLGIVQFSPSADVGSNLEAIARFAAEASRQGCRAVCFPECCLTGYDTDQAAKKALSRQDSALQAVSDISAEYGVDLLVGFLEKSREGLHITHGLFRPDRTREFYRKTHLGQKEARIFTPGDCLPVFPLSCGLTCGFQLCVETHFPEITQTLALKGAEVVFAPHAAPGGNRKRIWETCIPARSYDNRVYMACCNAFGGLYVTDPAGICTGSRFDAAPSLLVFEADAQAVAQYRSNSSRAHRFYPKSRRPELYQP